MSGLEMVTYSRQQMVEGGLWDKEEGGFFRYSAASDWSMPHTEKCWMRTQPSCVQC